MIVEIRVICVRAFYYCSCIALPEQQYCTLPMCMYSSICNLYQSASNKGRKPPKIFIVWSWDRSGRWLQYSFDHSDTGHVSRLKTQQYNAYVVH